MVVGVGFVDTDVSAYYDWIEDVTGLDFADSLPGPSELFFDTDFTTPGPQSAILDGFTPVWDNFHPFFTGGTEGFNYTWENDFAPIAVFGTSQTGANAVLVQSDINYQGIRFDPILEVINVDGFHLMDDGGSLRATAGGAVIEVNQNAIISASLAGATGEGIVKTGDAELVLDGNNTAFEAKLVIESGVVSVESQTALGGGIVSDESKTTVQSGGTLHLTGGGISLNERIEISGPGANNQGSIRVSRGQHAITQELTVVSDATIAVAENSTLTLSGQIEEHLDMAGEGATLTQTGDGTIVYSGQSNLNELHVDQGIAAGAGEFLGLVNVSASGELRPADTSAGRAIGSFQAGQLLVAEGSNIRFDISPILNTGDVVVVEENVILAGDLNVDFLGTPSVGDEFMLVNNLGNQNVVGEFANLNVSSSSPIPDGVRFLVNYAGGTGNDVVLVTAPASQVGDFDLDGDVDADDIDFYSGNLGQSAVADLAKLDLDGDGMVTLADHDQHITQLAQTSNGEVGALIGDINLDGDVDVLGDAFILVANLRSSGPNRYSSGDLNADQVVDVLGDAFRLVLNLGLSNEP